MSSTSNRTQQKLPFPYDDALIQSLPSSPRHTLSSGTLASVTLIIVMLFGLALAAPAVAQQNPDSAYKGPQENLHIYLLIGQSNMAGRAPFTPAEAGVIARCYLLNAQEQWEPAKNPLNRHSTIRKGLGMQRMNPGYMFARRMREKDDAVSIGLVVNAKGGTSINQWAKGGKFYQEAVRRTRIAQKTGTLRGILWHQGESDATDAGYLEKLKTLIADLRNDLGDSNLPFVAGQINNVPLINDQIAKLPSVVASTGFVSAEGLKATDRWHFNANSMRQLGERYAEAMQSLHAAPKESPERK